MIMERPAKSGYPSFSGSLTYIMEKRSPAQPSLFSTYEYVKPKEEKAEKVMRTLKKKFSEEDYRTICYALSSPDERKADAVFHTIVWGLKGQYRHSILEHLSNDNVRITMELARNAGNEYRHLRGFTRFTELQGGVLYGVISPKNAILPSACGASHGLLPF